MFKNTALVLVAALMLAATVAVADIPSLEFSTATIDAGAQGGVLYNRINGAGYAFTQAHLPGGAVVNGTITLHLVNYLGQPLPNHAAEDFWLTSASTGLVFPALGTIADAPTNASGITVWQQPLNAGGCSLSSGVVVRVEGDPLNQPAINFHFISADINGDLLVNLSDLALFSGSFGTYNGCADLFYDGAMNLTDLALFSQAYF